MRPHVLTQLTAPGGGTPLRAASVAEQRGGRIVRGAALSAEAGLFPIREGILNLLPQGAGPLGPGQWSNLLEPTARGYEWPWRAHSLTLFSGEPFGFERERALVAELLDEVGGGLWLDLAASTALYGRWLAPRVAPYGGEVVALDLAWPMLRRAQVFACREGHANLSFVAARGEALPFADGALAGVLCGGSLNEFGKEGAPRVLREVARALRPGAAALFMHLLEAERGAGRFFQRAVARRAGIAFWSRPAADALFEGAGLRVEARRAWGVVAFTRVRRE